jgi:hypothetical protein
MGSGLPKSEKLSRKLSSTLGNWDDEMLCEDTLALLHAFPGTPIDRGDIPLGL